MKKTTKQFIKEAKKRHKNKYDYSKSIYTGAHNKIKIICPFHGQFKQAPHSHLKGAGCWNCAVKLKGMKQRLGKEDFIKKSKAIHGNLYNYDLVEYARNWQKVKIICKKHGVFKQTPYGHYNGSTCPKCKNRNLTKKEQIKRFVSVHGNRYDYSLLLFAGSKSPIKIICKKHGEFLQTPQAHLRGHGCQKCGTSKNISELKLLKFLKSKLNEQIEYQKSFDWLGRMTLDIFIPSLNVAIEYQGIQHFKSLSFFGGKKVFNERKRLDKMKYKLCGRHNIKLLYFTYKEKQIPRRYIDKVYFSEAQLLSFLLRLSTLEKRGSLNPVP